MNLKKSAFLSYLLVGIQFTCIGLIGFVENGFPKSIFSFMSEIAGIVLMFWAFSVMTVKNVQALPDPKENAHMVSKGPYKRIRHPMYTSIFLMMIPMVIDYFNIWRLLILIVLIINQVIKLTYEENMLKEKYPNYSAYMKKSSRIIPYIF
ncbi:MAG: hypothetical protein C0594_08245 [Marinilabiliales bacterium]|nr:MAG: hypothetical protein C0594_08245 [Marinilabiliales bacterium]